jgi:hypothetical protein
VGATEDFYGAVDACASANVNGVIATLQDPYDYEAAVAMISELHSITLNAIPQDIYM